MKSWINIFDFNLDRIFIPLIMIYFRECVVRQVWRYQCTKVIIGSQSKHGRRTDNTMVKRNKRQTDLQNTSQSTKDYGMRNPLITLKNMMITKLSFELIVVALELVAFYRTLLANAYRKWRNNQTLKIKCR
jgi:hypothetical protein